MRTCRYEEALVAGLDPAVAAPYMNESEADRRKAEDELARLDQVRPPTAAELLAAIEEEGNRVEGPDRSARSAGSLRTWARARIDDQALWHAAGLNHRASG